MGTAGEILLARSINVKTFSPNIISIKWVDNSYSQASENNYGNCHLVIIRSCVAVASSPVPIFPA